MTELKPCPFCGGEAEIHPYGGGGYDVWCEGSCGAEINGFRTEAEAVEAWNRRVDPYDVYDGMKPMTEENLKPLGWVRERTCRYIGDEVSGGCSECRGWLDPACAYCPSCGAKVVDDD